MMLRTIAAQFILYSIFVMAITSPALAIDLSVTVLEKGSGDPIEGATVVLGQTGEYDVTDEKGSIFFEDIESFTKIKILNPGYETLEAAVEQNASKLTYYIYPITVEGEALEVVEDRIREKGSKITLVEAELRRVPGTAGDPLKVLAALPGVVSGQGQGGPGQLYIRGSGADDNGVLINRIPVEYLFHFGDLSGIAPSTINPSLVKDFNAFLGGFPVEYDDKLGGILDVQLRNPKTDRIHQTYRLAIHESAFLIEGPIPNKKDTDSFYVAGRISYLDRVLTPGIINKLINGDKTEEDSDFTIVTLPRYYDAQANWHRELKKGTLDAYFFTAGDSVAINLSDATRETDPALMGELAVDLDYYSVGVNWLHRYNSSLSQIGTWTLRQFNAKQNIGSDPVTGESFFVNTKNTFATFDPQLIWRASPKHELTMGTNLSRVWTPINLNISAKPTEEDPDQNFTTAEKIPIQTTFNAGIIAPYIKHRWAISDKLTSILGLRYSYAKASGGIEVSGFSPRTAIEYQLNRQFLFTASWGKYLQFPDGATLLADFGNPRLGFTEAEHRILGMEYKPSQRWLIKLEAYQKPMEKLVLRIPGATQPDNYKNIGKGEAYGVDLLIKREVSNRTLGWLSYSYAKSSRTTVQGINRDFTGDRPHTLNLVWSQPMTGSWKRWTWGVKVAVQSGATHTPVIGRTAICTTESGFENCIDYAEESPTNHFSHWEPKKAKQNSERLPFYYQMSVRFDRDIRFNNWKMNFFVDIQNLSFRKNIIGYNYGKRYEKIENREAVAAFFFPLPLFGIEATF